LVYIGQTRRTPGATVILFLTILVTLSLLLLAVFLAAVSRHKKSGTEEIRALGRVGTCETMLDPEGAVIVSGELWQALSGDGQPIPARTRIRVIGFKDHLALVEVCD
jgi:membrane protein implicated in regulation of membrane protease activity